MIRIQSADHANVDDLVDAACISVLEEGEGSEATLSLLLSLEKASSPLTRRSVAFALALTTREGDEDALDAILNAYRRAKGDPFLASSLLKALGLIALKDPAARGAIASQLHRLRPEHDRYVLLAAAKVIGLLDAVRPDLDLRGNC